MHLDGSELRIVLEVPRGKINAPEPDVAVGQVKSEFILIKVITVGDVPARGEGRRIFDVDRDPKCFVGR